VHIRRDPPPGQATREQRAAAADAHMAATTEQVNRPVAMLMAGKEGLDRVRAMGVVRFRD